MNQDKIETLLRNPPPVRVPEGLLGKLTEDIALGRAETGRMEWTAPQPWLRRWMPALSFLSIFLGCLVVIAVQTNLLSDLRRQNEQLRAEQGSLEALRGTNGEWQRLHNENQELDRLRKDNLELQQLRDEVARLQSQTKDLAALRAQNTQLHSALAGRRAADEPENLSPEEQARQERIKCVNNLKQIGLAARIWAGDNHDHFPTNFVCQSNELSTWRILQCPADKIRDVSSWEDVAAGNISYIMDAPGVSDTNPTVIYVECPIHHNVCLVDGSVQQLSEKYYQEHVKTVDGQKIFE